MRPADVVFLHHCDPHGGQPAARQPATGRGAMTGRIGVRIAGTFALGSLRRCNSSVTDPSGAQAQDGFHTVELFRGGTEVSPVNSSVKDPVCGRKVHSREISTVFLGTEYGFCSVECRDRFLAFPHLYAGLRGQRSPCQRGLQVLQHRRLSLAAPLSPEQGARVTEALEGLSGIRAVEVRGNRIEFVCDLMKVEARQIEIRLAAVGARLGEGWEERLRQGLEN